MEALASLEYFALTRSSLKPSDLILSVWQNMKNMRLIHIQGGESSKELKATKSKPDRVVEVSVGHAEVNRGS